MRKLGEEYDLHFSEGNLCPKKLENILISTWHLENVSLNAIF